MKPLDSFQTALLSELTDHVRARRAGMAGAPETARELPHRALGRGSTVVPMRPRRRAPLAAAAAAIAALGIAAGAITLTARPAFAVTTGSGNLVTVRVDRLEDAAALEGQLARLGVAADIQYLDGQKLCQQDRYAHAENSPVTSTEIGPYIEFRFDLDGVRPEHTIVLAATKIENGSAFQFGVADGAVAPCVPTPTSGVPPEGCGSRNSSAPGTVPADEPVTTRAVPRRSRPTTVDLPTVRDEGARRWPRTPAGSARPSARR